MVFATAGFLLALAGLAIPWWLHRRETHSSAATTVGSLMLLREAEVPEAQRRTLHYRALLSVRLLLMLLLVLAFAEPVLESFSATPAAAGVPARLVVVDTSASMTPHFSEATAAARELLSGRAALAAAGSEIALITPMTDSALQQIAGLASLAPGTGRLAYGGLLARISTLADSLASPGQKLDVHFLSDFQASAAPGRFNELIAGSTHPVTLHPIGNPERPNWRVVNDSARRLVVEGFATPAVDVPLRVLAEGDLVHAETVTVPASGRTVVTLPPPPDSRHDVRLTAILDIPNEDTLALDDRAFFVSARQYRRPVPVLGDRVQQRYIAAALSASEAGEPVVGLVGPVAVVVDPAGDDDELRGYLEQGGRALVFAGADSRRAGDRSWLPLLSPGSLAASGSHRLVFADHSHDALVRTGGWADAAVFQHVGLEAGDASVLISLDNGEPWLIERAVGRGRMLLVGSSLDPQWTNLPASASFVNFIVDAIAYLAEDFDATAVSTGSAFWLPPGNGQLISSAGERLLSLQQSRGESAVTLTETGHYQLRMASIGEDGQSPPPETPRRYLAANLPSAESDLTIMSEGSLRRWQQAIAGDASAAAGTSAAGEYFDIELAPWLLALALLVVALEIFAANGAPVGLARRFGGSTNA
jgi:hypothetical protein